MEVAEHNTYCTGAKIHTPTRHNGDKAASHDGNVYTLEHKEPLVTTKHDISAGVDHRMHLTCQCLRNYYHCIISMVNE